LVTGYIMEKVGGWIWKSFEVYETLNLRMMLK